MAGDVALEDFLENAGELANALVEERQQLVGLEVQVRLEVLDALVLEAQAQQDRCLRVRQRHRRAWEDGALGEVEFGESRHDVHDEMEVN